MSLFSLAFPPPFISIADKVLHIARENKASICTAESCTGGLVAASLTAIPGASDVFTVGFVTYANDAKQQQLSVPASLLINHGAVSKEVALAMAYGACRNGKASTSVSITGIAGPGGGSQEKPVGTVYIATCHQEIAVASHFHFSGNREEIRYQATEAALTALYEALAATAC